MNYSGRTDKELEIIRKAYDFEIELIKAEDLNTKNPYIDAIKEMGIWSAFCDAIDMHFYPVEQLNSLLM